MTPFEHTTIALICMGAAFVWGRMVGLKSGIVATLNYLEDQGLIILEREEDDE